MRGFPDSVWFCSVLVLVFFLFYIRYGLSLVFFCGMLTVVLFSYIFVADQKIRIIPDQFIGGLLFTSLLWMVNDFRYLQETGDAWYRFILMRLLGGLIGGVVLFGVGWIGTRIFKEDAMGMGDIKLVSACGILVGMSGILWVLAMSFLFAFLPALVNLLRLRRSKRKQIPFAPFIVTAATLYLLFPSEFELFFSWYRQLMK